MKSLTQITNELVVSNMTVQLNQGEIDTVLEQELITLQNELSTKVDHYFFRIKSLRSRAEFIKEEGKRLIEVSKTIDAHVDAMEDRIKLTMNALEVNKLEGEKYKFTVRATPKPKVNILDESLVPNEFKTLEQKWVVSKDLVREAIESGKEVLGAELIQGQTLISGVVK